eukprot:tig00000270_g23919.t1
MSYCETCSQARHSKRAFAGHTIRKGAAVGESCCRKHPSELLTLVCVKCNEVVCAMCAAVGAHRGHEPLRELGEEYEAARAGAEASLAQAEARERQLRSQVAEAADHESACRAHFGSQRAVVLQAAEQALAAVAAWRARAFEDVTRAEFEALAALQRARGEAEARLAAVAASAEAAAQRAVAAGRAAAAASAAAAAATGPSAPPRAAALQEAVAPLRSPFEVEAYPLSDFRSPGAPGAHAQAAASSPQRAPHNHRYGSPGPSPPAFEAPSPAPSTAPSTIAPGSPASAPAATPARPLARPSSVASVASTPALGLGPGPRPLRSASPPPATSSSSAKLQQEYNKLSAENIRLEQEGEELRRRLGAAEQQRELLKARLAELRVEEPSEEEQGHADPRVLLKRNRMLQIENRLLRREIERNNADSAGNRIAGNWRSATGVRHFSLGFTEDGSYYFLERGTYELHSKNATPLLAQAPRPQTAGGARPVSALARSSSATGARLRDSVARARAGAESDGEGEDDASSAGPEARGPHIPGSAPPSKAAVRRLLARLPKADVYSAHVVYNHPLTSTGLIFVAISQGPTFVIPSNRLVMLEKVVSRK